MNTNITPKGFARLYNIKQSAETEMNLLSKRIRLLNEDIEQDENQLDIIAGRLETSRTQRDRAVKRIQELLVDDAVHFPTFLFLEPCEMEQL